MVLSTKIGLFCLILWIHAMSSIKANDDDPKSKHPAKAATGNEEHFKKIQEAFDSFCDKQAEKAKAPTKKGAKAGNKLKCCNKLREFVKKHNKYSGKKGVGAAIHKVGKLLHKHAEKGKTGAEGTKADVDLLEKEVPECIPFREKLNGLKGAKKAGVKGLLSKMTHHKTETKETKTEQHSDAEGKHSLLHPLGGKKKEKGESETTETKTESKSVKAKVHDLLHKPAGSKTAAEAEVPKSGAPKTKPEAAEE